MKFRVSRELTLALALLVLVTTAQVVNRTFLTGSNIRDLLIQISPFAIIACGMAMIVLLGEIDVSVGSMVGLLAAVLGLTVSKSHLGLSPLVSMVVIIGSGVALGLVNGLLVTLGRIPSIIVTLGMLTVVRGATQSILGGNWITDIPPEVRTWGIGSVGPIPIPVFVAVIVVAVTMVVLNQTPFGRRLYAVGSNPHAADIRGLPSKAIKIASFAALGGLTGLATCVSVPQLSVVDSSLGAGWELFVITCVVLGGISIKGGSGTLLGAIIGVCLLGIVRTVLVFLKLGDEAVYWERAVQGILILAAVVIDRLTAIRKQGALA